MERERALAMQRGLAELAAADGLDLRFDLARGGNSFDAHRLLQLGRELGVQSGVKERLMHAYFTEGEPIGDREALARIAPEAGLPEDEVRELLADGALRRGGARGRAGRGRPRHHRGPVLRGRPPHGRVRCAGAGAAFEAAHEGADAGLGGMDFSRAL